MRAYTTYRLTIALLAAALVAVSVGYCLRGRQMVKQDRDLRVFSDLAKETSGSWMTIRKLREENARLRMENGEISDKLGRQIKALTDYDAYLRIHERSKGRLRLSGPGAVTPGEPVK